MLLFYVDESGGTSMNFASANGIGVNRAVGEYFVLAAVGIHDTSREPLANALMELKRKHFGKAFRADHWEATEIKGTRLASLAKKRPTDELPKPMQGYVGAKDPQHLGYLLTELGQILTKFRPTIFAVLVDKAALAASGGVADPLGAAYTRLYERVALTVQAVNAGEGALFVADEQSEHEKYFESGAFFSARKQLGSKGKNKANFNVVIDKPLWVDTRLSIWDREILQLPDIVAYSTYAWYKAGGPPEGKNFLWDKIAPLFAAHWNTTKAQGGGIIVYPDPGKYPPVT